MSRKKRATRTHRSTVNFTADDWARVEMAARESDRAVADYIRIAAVNAATASMATKGRKQA